MLKKTPTGLMDFKEIREENYYIVDKTLLIKDFLDYGKKVTLITRPRRFGKTLNMSMMSEFFDITKDSKKLFEGTKIMDTSYANEMNQWPVIFISFANAKEDKETIVKYIKTQIQSEYIRYNYLFKNLNELELNDYNMIINVLKNKDNSILKDVDNALEFLMIHLQKHYNKKVMVFIDEYDTPFVEAKVGEFYHEIKGSLSTLLRSSLKNSYALANAMLTGIQRVAKENIFSDLNNLIVCDVTDDRYSNYFGFTTDETRSLLEYYGLKLNNEVKEMYDGYKIGETDIYNPWSILNYVDSKKLIPYWKNTSANIMIKQAMRTTDEDFKSDFETLIKNGYVETEVQLQTSFYEENSTSCLWGLFVNAGYLTIDQVIDITDGICVLKIPNQEVRKEFISFTEYFLSLQGGQINRLIRFLTSEKQEEFIKEYQKILLIPSYYDLLNENSYHMFVLGSCVCLYNRYEIKSNREEGKGRCDIILKSKNNNQPSFVLEFKYLKTDKKDIKEELNNLANQAIQQIKDNQYDYDLTGKIIYIGLAHHGKDVSIKWEEK